LITKKQIRVLHVTNNYPTTSNPVFGIFVKEQIDSLTSAGIVNDVFFINGKELGKKAYFKSLFELRRVLRNDEFEIVHCHHSFSAIVLLLTFSHSKSRTIVSYQNDPDREGGLWLYSLLRFFFDGVILKNNKSEFMFPNTHYLPNGVNMNYFKPLDRLNCKTSVKLQYETRYILFMDSNKGKRTQKRIDRFNEVIRILKEDLQQQNIEPLILTNTPRDQMATYISASSLHIISSDFEGSPNSVKECLASNVKVVSTPVGNIEDLIGDVPSCYISKTFEPNDLARLALKALDSEDYDGRSYIYSKELDMDNVTRKLISRYREILGGTV
jgi:teichuronic acid biosynthesis glycosyltransferase TuaC